ncbi:MAG TPA: hypothetical protein VOA88_15870 [Candidatus Dormibacteraeota bacterium]|nr:hypothetical protein [Candidatus Dormibacteraeota bacterium]
MDLATQQRKLLRLFRGTYRLFSDDDNYISRVAQSNHLQEGRRNILLWRIYVLERTCALTVTLLRQRNILEETVSAFIEENNISPFRETQALAFLDVLGRHNDHLIASVAQFELALIKVKQGDSCSYLVSWSVDPSVILYSLARNIPLEDEVQEAPYQVLISRDIPWMFQIWAA